MRSLIIGLILCLTACGGNSTSTPPIDNGLVQVQAQVAALSKALADSTHVQAAQADSLKKLTLIGKVHGVSSELRMQGEFRTDAQATGISFGPCADMGVLVGRGNDSSSPSADPLSANLEAFQQCTGYSYNTVLGSGAVGTAPRIFFDGPCVNGEPTGNALEWEAGGGGYNTQTLENGVVFLSPVDGAALMVRAGQTAQPILIQSVWVLSNPGCQSDIETQLMYAVTSNDVSVTGVPTDLPKVPQLTAP